MKQKQKMLSQLVLVTFSDPFLPHFSRNAKGIMASSRSFSAAGSSVTSRSSTSVRIGGQPIVRRGTFARVCCIDRAIAIFVSSTFQEPSMQQRQVVILGAGKDTTFLRYQADLLTTPTTVNSTPDVNIQWYEVDLPSVIETKKRLLKTIPQNLMAVSPHHTTSSPHLLPATVEERSVTKTPTQNSTEVPFKAANSSYHLVPFDLRSDPVELFELLTSNKAYNFNRNAPTIFVLECVFMYLSEDSTKRLLSAISELCKLPLVVIYDPILQQKENESSPFGNMMHQHLKRAGVLPRERPSSIETCVTVSIYQDKLFNCGFDTVIGCNMADAYESIVSKSQRNHVSSIEMLDELEEWMLLMNHYCFITATTSAAAQTCPLLKKFFVVSDEENFTSSSTVPLEDPISSLGFIKGKCIRRQ
jgi:O-methyltransferase involved in polyketide biosynthesis